MSLLLLFRPSTVTSGSGFVLGLATVVALPYYNDSLMMPSFTDALDAPLYDDWLPMPQFPDVVRLPNSDDPVVPI